MMENYIGRYLETEYRRLESDSRALKSLKNELAEAISTWEKLGKELQDAEYMWLEQFSGVQRVDLQRYDGSEVDFLRGSDIGLMRLEWQTGYIEPKNRAERDSALYCPDVSVDEGVYPGSVLFIRFLDTYQKLVFHLGE